MAMAATAAEATNDGWDKQGFETWCVSSPQVRFSLLYIFDYINEYLQGTIPMNGDARHGREESWGLGINRGLRCDGS